MREPIKVDTCNGCAECIGCGRGIVTELQLFCDICNEHIEKAYVIDGEDVCEECLEVLFEVVKEDEL